jgi:hypothetical protein
MGALRKAVLGAVTAAAVMGAGLVPGTTAAAAEPVDPAVLGTAPELAAGSCWEVKQLRPTADSGSYWLLTAAMAEPARFYCDMATDGGGWVLVGKGRDGWTDAYEGQGDLAELLAPGLATMGPKTTQYAADTVDGLLAGGRVDALAEGVRLRRATNTAGTTWQEVRMRLARRDRWVWTFGAEHPLGGWSFDNRTGSGGTTGSFGSDTTYRRVVSTPQSAQGYRLGFAYGSRVAGSSSASSYLWSKTNGAGGALPYTEVYLRPRVTSTSGFAAIGDEGTAAQTEPATFKSRALDSPWGVTGVAGITTTEGNVEVQAFTQSGGTMYVGGNFAAVQRDATGTDRVAQPFLAAFDVATGELVPGFRPVLNEQVHALTTLPDGTVVAGGRFTRANGAPATGIVALDPATGATRDSWRLTVENRTKPSGLMVRTFDVQDGWLYIGGAFTHMTGGRRATATPTQNLGRVEVGDATPGKSWNPKLNGTVNDVDASADGRRVYAAGYFGKSNGVTALRAAVLSTGTGAALTPFAPTWSSSTNNYQRVVQEVGGRVYFGGSEHSLFGFDTTSLARTSGSIAKAHGDIQTVTATGGTVYAGCHCDDYVYENAFAWPTLGNGWTQGDSIGWIAAWDAATGRQVPQFNPVMKSRLGSGAWAAQADSAGNLWVGGDFVTATTKSKAAKWTGGFVRFDPADSVAPGTPSDLRVTEESASSVTLAWGTVGDAGGGVRYQVLRDDRTVATTAGNTGTLTVPRGGDDRFFVRAVDRAGNLSASTPVLALG